MSLGVICMRAWPATDLWPRQTKFALTALAVALATIIEVPESFDAPGKPFLLYFIASAFCGLAFGPRFGLLSIAASALFSVLFFDPVYSFWLSNRKDLVDIIAFAFVGSASILILARIKASVIAGPSAREQTSRLMLNEMAHRVANNFAAAVAILGRASTSVRDIDAKRALDDALNQLHIFASVHGQLRPDTGGNLCVDGTEFIGGLCVALKKTAPRGAKCKFEDPGISIALMLPQAVALGLIVNELVTNCFKHAFPAGRPGTIFVTLRVHDDECQICVADNGVGTSTQTRGGGRGLALIEGLAQQLNATFSTETSPAGTRGKVRFPLSRTAVR